MLVSFLLQISSLPPPCFMLSQIKNLWDVVPAVAGDRFLSMLPPWHAYERACEYFIFTHGIKQVYTNVRNLKVQLVAILYDFE